MTEMDLPEQAGMSEIVCNAFGEQSLFAVNQHLFHGTDASTVFRSYYGDSLFKEDTFYVIAGTDSGLLYQYVKSQGVPKGSRYMFVELPQILEQLTEFHDPEGKLVVTTEDKWLDKAREMNIAFYAIQKQATLIQSLGVIHGHFGAYHPFWRKLKEQFDTFVWDVGNTTNYRPFIAAQIGNLTENQIPAIHLENKFNGKTAVLLAGGPSLDELLPWVRENRDNLLVVAVSIIGKTLAKAGIQPDVIMSIDPNAVNLYLCKNILQFQDSALLVNNNHLSTNLLSSWGGSKVYVGTRYPWISPSEPLNFPLSGGTTVTNSAFQFIIETGVAQIILCGVDLCFSQEGHTYSSGTGQRELGTTPRMTEREVETNSGKMADTLNSYHRSGLSIDLQAEYAVSQGVRVINPAPHAMRLPHVEFARLEDIPIEPMEHTAREIINNSLPVSTAETRTNHYKDILLEVDRILKDLRSIKELSNKALEYNRKLFANGKPNSNYHNKIKMDRIEKQLKEKYADTSKLVKHFGVHRLAPILILEKDSVDVLEKNSQIYFQAFIDTCDELIGMLRKIRKRILSRLEEEKPQPNIGLLIEHWDSDNQPGHAIQWIKKHNELVSELPQEQQKALFNFENIFNETMEKLGDAFMVTRKQYAGLLGIAGQAKTQFQNHHEDGLTRLLASLEGYCDQEEAESLIFLVKGYLAEINNDKPVAIEYYQKITDGPALPDASMRLFDLYTKANNWDAALNVLKALSTIDPVYSPMYADMLYANGDVDNAVNIYTEYLLANPDDLNTMMKLGKLFLECGSSDGVNWTMNYILNKDPGNHTAKEILNQIESISSSEMQ